MLFGTYGIIEQNVTVKVRLNFSTIFKFNNSIFADMNLSGFCVFEAPLGGSLTLNFDCMEDSKA